MPNLNAALLVAQLENLDNFVTKKRNLAKLYENFFTNSDYSFLKEPANCESNYWLNTILLKNKNERDNFLEFSNKNGIMTRPIWRLMNKLEMFNDCQCGDIKNAEYFAERAVNIPSSVNL
jgi:dTDP-4-amino-4,6-dideoxygalactose transaminase